jgi:hypothetical protein
MDHVIPIPWMNGPVTVTVKDDNRSSSRVAAWPSPARMSFSTRNTMSRDRGFGGLDGSDASRNFTSLITVAQTAISQ